MSPLKELGIGREGFQNRRSVEGKSDFRSNEIPWTEVILVSVRVHECKVQGTGFALIERTLR